MADRYWVGGNDTWDATAGTKWATTSGGTGGAAVPTSSDDVYFDANSASAYVWLGAGVTPCGSLDFTGFTGEFEYGNVDVYGDLTLDPGTTYTLDGSNTEYFSMEGTGSHTITTNGVTIPSRFTVVTATGTYTLQDDLVCDRLVSISEGTFDANDHDVTADYFFAGTSSPTIYMGSGTWEATTSSASNVFNTSSTLTLDAGTSTFKATGSGSNAKTFSGAFSSASCRTFNRVEIETDNLTFNLGANFTINELILNTAGFANATKITSGRTITVTDFDTNGYAGNLVKLTSVTAASAATLSKASGIISEDYLSLQDMTATGGATWYAGQHSTNVSGNTGWIFSDGPLEVEDITIATSVDSAEYADEPPQKKTYLHKVYSRSRATLSQFVQDGNFEGLNDTNFTTYWESVGSPELFTRNRITYADGTTVGKALQFDGSVHYLELPVYGTNGVQSPDITLTSNFTILLSWFKSDWRSDGELEQILYNRDSSIGVHGLELTVSAGAAGYLQALCVISSVVRTASYPLTSISGGWHTIGISVSSGVVRLILDGAIVASNSGGSGGSTSVDVGQNLLVGAKRTWTGTTYNYSYFATGYLDNIAIYGSALTTAQLNEYHTSRNPLRDDLISYWDINEGSGSTIEDEITDFTGSLTGTPIWRDGITTVERSLMVVTESGGATDQGVQQTSTDLCIVEGDTDYTGSAYVKADAGEVITMTLTPTGGGSPQANSLVANGEWQLLANTYTTDPAATALRLKITLDDSDSAEKTFYVDKIALNNGTTPQEYFDGDSESDNALYVYDTATLSHTIISNVFTYIGVWEPDVISDFGYPQEINSAGSEYSVTLKREAGSYGEGEDIDFNLDVRVYEYSPTNINGILKFNGYISDYTIDEKANLIQVFLFGYGAELKNKQLELGDNIVAFMPIYSTSESMTGVWSSKWLQQTINPEVDTVVDKIRVRIQMTTAYTRDLTIGIYEGDPTLNSIDVTGGMDTYTTDPSNILIAESTNAITPAATTPTDYDLEFDRLTLQAGGSYYVSILPGSDFDGVFMGSSATTNLVVVDGYAPLGRVYSAQVTVNNSSSFLALDAGMAQLYMALINTIGSTSTTVAFNSKDPSYIVRKAMDNYRSQGGVLTYDEQSIPLSGTVTSYEFKTATIYDVIEKALELAPVDWYFYVDHSENKLHFKPKQTTADHTFILGKHIKELVIEKLSREVVNDIRFVGGEDESGVNFYKKYTSQASVDTYGARMLIYTDNRVTREDTADTIAQNILTKRNFAEIRTSPEIIDYDEVVRPGDMVTFRGHPSETGELSLFDVGKFDLARFDFDHTNPTTFLLQIARVHERPNQISVTLSTTPPDVNKRIEDINRNLEKLQTINNPDEPS